MHREVIIREKVDTLSVEDALKLESTDAEKKTFWGRLVDLVAPKKKKKRSPSLHPMR